MTRGEAAVFLHAILTRTFNVEAPAAPVTLENAAGVNTNDFLLELRKVPKPILDTFNAAGWTYRIDFDYMGELSDQMNMSCCIWQKRRAPVFEELGKGGWCK